MALTLSHEAHLEFRCFGMLDRYPKDLRAAVTGLQNPLRERQEDHGGKENHVGRLSEAVPDGFGDPSYVRH